jgi:hypothetical protein
MRGRNKRRFDRDYAQLMINHPWGWGLYKPVPSTQLKPGSCGYFDAAGYWQPIVQLTEKLPENWKAAEPPLRVVTEKGSTPWGPKTSDRVQTISFDLQTGSQYVQLSFRPGNNTYLNLTTCRPSKDGNPKSVQPAFLSLNAGYFDAKVQRSGVFR